MCDWRCWVNPNPRLAAVTAMCSLLQLGAVAASPAGHGEDRAAAARLAGIPETTTRKQAHPAYQRSVQSYTIPALEFVDQDGRTTTLPAALGDAAVMVNFIFTSCRAICPVMSATFADVQRQLQPRPEHLKLVSISIDPEYDTPQRMRGYAARFSAAQGWEFLTGQQAVSLAAQRAFGAYRGNKMNHAPLTFLRKGPGAPWVRLEGFVTASDLINEYRTLMD